jgi:glycosyltransferase involved in cell wall biosynthesis
MGRFIERTLLSIFRQNYPGRLQVIVADGGSKDDTVAILKRYPQVTWWSRKDNGIADAVNQGFAESDGEILAEQGSDDYYLPGAFEWSVGALMRDRQLDIVAGTDVFLNDDGRTFTCSKLEDHEITPKSLILRRVIPLHCGFFRRSVLQTTGGMRCFGRTMADSGGNIDNVGLDIDFWYRALHFHKGKFIPHHTAVYQLHREQMTVNSPSWYRNMTEMVESCERDPEFADRFKLTTQERQNAYVRWEIQQAKLLGRIDEVEKLVRKVMEDTAFTEETRQHLASHGFVSKPQRSAMRSPQSVPDIDWWKREPVVALAG